MLSPVPDVAVIGAGIIGASIAWRLAQSGTRVMLFERRGMGEEASWAGAGMLAPGGEIEERSAWTEFALESLGLYGQFIHELESETGHRIDFRRSGAVEIAATASEFESLLSRSRTQSGLGIRSTPMDRTDLQACVPLLRSQVAGALHYPDDAVVDPRDVMRTLKIACLARGVGIREGCAVDAIRLRAGSVELEAGTERIVSRFAVLAAGAWSSRIAIFCGQEPMPVPESFPVRGHLLGYALERGSLGPILRHGSTYVLQRSGGLTIAGSSSERVGFDRTADPTIVSDIAARAGNLLPCLRAMAQPETWLGFRPATGNLQPVIQRAGQSNLWLAYGHYRNGILLAPATAARISGQVIANSGTG